MVADDLVQCVDPDGESRVVGISGKQRIERVVAKDDLGLR
jgi:hypothetical protein